MCGLDVLRGFLNVGWDMEKFRAWPIMSMTYCKCICKKNIFLCSSNFKYGELVRVLSVKREVSSSNPIVNRGDKVRLPQKSRQSKKHFFFPKNPGSKKIKIKNLIFKRSFCDQINRKNQQNCVTSCPSQCILSNNCDQHLSVDFWLIKAQNFYQCRWENPNYHIQMSLFDPT